MLYISVSVIGLFVTCLLPKCFNRLLASSIGSASNLCSAINLPLRSSAESIAVAVLQQLCNEGEIKQSIVTQAMDKYRIHDVSAADAGNTEGSG